MGSVFFELLDYFLEILNFRLQLRIAIGALHKYENIVGRLNGRENQDIIIRGATVSEL